jgi:hypothetical protein
VPDQPDFAGPHIDERFIAAFGSRFDVIALRLAEGLDELSGIATCTDDELALHLVIEYAEDLYGDGALDWEWIDALPVRLRDEDFGRLKDLLFEDNDVLILYNPAMDGAEDPESEVAQLERFVNLHPNDWSTPPQREALDAQARSIIAVKTPLDSAGIELPADIVVLQATPSFRAAVQGDAALTPGGAVRAKTHRAHETGSGEGGQADGWLES